MTEDREPADHDRPTTGDPAPEPEAAHAADLGRWHRRAWLTDVGDVDCAVRLEAGTADLLGWTAADLAVVPAGELVHPDDRDLLVSAAETVECDVPRLVVACSAPFTPLLVRMLARDRRYWSTRWHVGRAADRSVVATGVDYVRPHSEPGPPVGMWWWDVDADVVSWSPDLVGMFCQELGPPTSYRAFLDAVLDDDRDEVDEAMRFAVDGDDGYAITFRCRAFGGQDRWLHATGRRAPTTEGGGRRVGGLVKHLNPRPVRRPARAVIGSG